MLELTRSRFGAVRSRRRFRRIGSVEERQLPKRSVLRLPLDRINWVTSSFLIGTLVLTLTTGPLHLYHFGLDWFRVALFFATLLACGFRIAIGYHRLFSHITFRASWPIRLLTLIFGAAAFEDLGATRNWRAGRLRAG
jgi:fatty-acid desaturase